MDHAEIEAALDDLQRALAGRFSLIREIGRGGMGVVVLAEDVLLGRRVAIKMLAPSVTGLPGIRKRFLREARLAARCFHPNIVPIHEVGETDSLAWFVMAWVNGESLAERLARSGPLQPSELERLAREIGWALTYAHEKGLIHRDIKPANILLEEGTGRALLADFGIARSIGDNSDSPMAGTSNFMAPEQLKGSEVDGRADLYSLGVTLRMASPPGFSASSAIPAQRALADAIEICTRAAPTQRFGSAAEFLTRITESEPTPSLSPSALIVREQASAFMSSISWTLAVGLAGLALVTGEDPGSFGRALTAGISQFVFALFAAVTVARGAEATLKTRKSLKEGLTLAELQKALSVGSEATSERQIDGLRTFLKGSLSVACALCIAMASAKVDSWQFLPDSLTAVLKIMTIAGPALLMKSGVTSIWNAITSRSSLAARMASRAGAALFRIFGHAGSSAPEPAILEDINLPTEARLARLVEEMAVRLPDDHLQGNHGPGVSIASLKRAAIDLASTASHLRQRDQELSLLTGNTDERRGIRSRMAIAIAALENMRLDLLRLEHDRTLTGAITDPLEVVRDLHRHVEAMDEIRRALAHPSIP